MSCPQGGSFQLSTTADGPQAICSGLLDGAAVGLFNGLAAQASGRPLTIDLTACDVHASFLPVLTALQAALIQAGGSLRVVAAPSTAALLGGAGLSNLLAS